MQLNGTMETEIKTLQCLFIVYLQSQSQCYRLGKRQQHPYQNNTYMLLRVATVCSLPGGERVRRRAVGNQLCQFKESVVLHMKKHTLTRRNTLTHTCARTLAVLSPFTSVSCEATADTSASLFLASACKTQAHMLKCRSAEQQCQLSLHLVALS